MPPFLDHPRPDRGPSARFRRQNETGQVMLIFALSIVVLLGCAGLALDVSWDRSSGVASQGIADSVATSAATLWASKTPSAAPASSTDTAAAGIGTRVVSIAAVNGIPVAEANLCAAGSGYDLTYYDTATGGGACAAPAAWDNSVEVRIPPSPVPTDCSPSYACVQVILNTRVHNQAFGILGQPTTLVGRSAVVKEAGGGGGSPTWTVATSPNTSSSDQNMLWGTTCVSSTLCWAVGFYEVGSNPNQTLIEKFDGTSWAIIPSPNTNAASSNQLWGVGCADATHCWAVGRVDSSGVAPWKTLIEVWNGSNWTIRASPSPAGDNRLWGVSCVSTTVCWAAGDTNGTTPLVEKFSAGAWTTVAVSSVGGSIASIFEGITCPAATTCWAVGYYTTGAGYNQTFIQKWDGTSWAIVASPNIGATNNEILRGVACDSSGICMAVGQSQASGFPLQSFTEQWNGTNWTIVASPNVGTLGTFLTGVACPAVSTCYASGQEASSCPFVCNYSTVVEAWNGTAWSVATTPNAPSGLTDMLWGISCSGTPLCFAVGYYAGAASIYQTLILRMGGGGGGPTTVTLIT